MTLLPDHVLPSPTDLGWVKTEGLYETHWTTLSRTDALVAARVVAERAACARRLHFSAQASAYMRENMPADSKISDLLKH